MILDDCVKLGDESKARGLKDILLRLQGQDQQRGPMRRQGFSPLLAAVWYEDVDAIRSLAATYGQDVDDDLQGETGALLAARWGLDESLACLIELGCSLEKADEEGATPAYEACRGLARCRYGGSSPEARLKVLQDGGANLNMVMPGEDLERYGRWPGDTDGLFRTERGWTLAHLAAAEGNATCLQFLLDAGVDAQATYTRTNPDAWQGGPKFTDVTPLRLAEVYCSNDRAIDRDRQAACIKLLLAFSREGRRSPLKKAQLWFSQKISYAKAAKSLNSAGADFTTEHYHGGNAL
jgi:ankyrin repeat protein